MHPEEELEAERRRIMELWDNIDNVKPALKEDLANFWLKKGEFKELTADVEILEHKVIKLLQVLSQSTTGKVEYEKHAEHLLSLLHHTKLKRRWVQAIRSDLDYLSTKTEKIEDAIRNLREIRKQADISYVVDEHMLSIRLGIKIDEPIRVISLDVLGINTQVFLNELSPSFTELDWDYYDVKVSQMKFLLSIYKNQQSRLAKCLFDSWTNGESLAGVEDLIAGLDDSQRIAYHSIRPFRKRSVARFELVYATPSRWIVNRINVGNYSQNAASLQYGDYRKLPRKFKDSSASVAQHPLMIALITKLGWIVKGIKPQAKKLIITMHQVSIIATALGATNAPEGVHQDGDDFIVTGLSVERRDMIGAESIVYYKRASGMQEYLRYTSPPGQGVFQADKNTNLWHDVTKIFHDPSKPGLEGVRNIFGFDINIAE